MPCKDRASAATNGVDRIDGPHPVFWNGLPVPGTFVIDRQGIIRAAFADTDYTRRMEPAAIVEALSDIAATSESAAARHHSTQSP